MRAIVLPSAEANPVHTDFPAPDPLPDRAPLSLVGAGLHQVVRALATGRHYGSANTYPLVPGVDAVARTSDGTLVYTGWPQAPWGTMAETLCTPFDMELPPGADPLAVAAGMNPGMSGWLPLAQHRHERETLGTVLILGATGVAGRMAANAAEILGADRVIGAGRDAPTLAALAASGVDIADLADDSALERTIAESAPDLVLDYVWGPVAERTFTALARTGLHEDAADISYVQIGALAGAHASVPAALLRSRRIRISGSGAGSVTNDTLSAEIPRLMAHIADGTLTVPYVAYPFDRIYEAWTHTGRSRAVLVPR